MPALLRTGAPLIPVCRPAAPTCVGACRRCRPRLSWWCIRHESLTLTAGPAAPLILLQAMPSQAELSFQQFKQRKKALEGATKEDILAK